jgi:hypothetical protein
MPTMGSAQLRDETSAKLLTIAIAACSCFLLGFMAGGSGLSGFQLRSKADTAAIRLHTHKHAHPLPKYLPPIKSRGELPKLLETEGHEVGVELGVQRGNFAAETLRLWPRCKKYYLVDIWAPQDNYKVRSAFTS